MDEFDEYIPQCKFELIPISNLTSQQGYQRNISMKHVDRAVEEFDLFQVNPVKVSRRNGINYVFDGQHTIEIIAKKSQSRQTPVWCMVFEELEYREEADIFANQMKYKKKLSPYEVFMANVEAENEQELQIKSLVESYSLRITPTKQPGGICAVRAMETIYDTYGFSTLDKTLRLAIGTWEGISDSLSSSIIKALALIIDAYGDKLNEEIFKEKLGILPIKILTRSATERGRGTLGYAETMVDAYNKRMKIGALRLDILHKANNRKKQDKKKEQKQLLALLDAAEKKEQEEVFETQ